MSLAGAVPAAAAAQAAATGPRRRRVRAGDNLAGYMFLLPWLAGLSLFVAGPALVSLYLSFTNYDLLDTPRWVGAQNYVRMFTTDARYAHALRVTLVYVALAVPLNLAASLALAVALNRRMGGVGLYRSVFYVPSLLGGSVAVSILWRQMFGLGGLLSRLLDLAGIHGVSLVSSPGGAIWPLILLHVWQFGSPMVIFLAALKQVPAELYEAAAIDGAGAWRRFAVITVPMLTPVILFNLVLQVINAFQAFTPSFIISGGTGGPLDSTLFYTLYLYIQGFANLRMGYAAAMGWVLVVMIGAATALIFLSSRFWVHYEDGGR